MLNMFQAEEAVRCKYEAYLERNRKFCGCNFDESCHMGLEIERERKEERSKKLGLHSRQVGFWKGWLDPTPQVLKIRLTSPSFYYVNFRFLVCFSRPKNHLEPDCNTEKITSLKIHLNNKKIWFQFFKLATFLSFSYLLKPRCQTQWVWGFRIPIQTQTKGRRSGQTIAQCGVDLDETITNSSNQSKNF